MVFTGQTADGRTVTYTDGKRYFWFFSFLLALVTPATVALYFWTGSVFAVFFPLAYMYMFIPLLDRAVGEDTHNPPEEVVEATLDEVIARRARFVAEYQDEAYADRYRALVDLAREAERDRIGAEGAFADAVARSYFKLLAYKDEYEVARLHTLPEFHAALEREFEGDFRVAYHFAPPLFPGRPRKRRFGPWIRPVLAGLARLRGLRGTALDPFGWTAERRRERALVAEYEASVRDLALRLSPQNQSAAVELAALPQRIRGYGHVKGEALEAATARAAELRAALQGR
jgi:indolepyruvate ferredoxin oxidoreductase